MSAPVEKLLEAILHRATLDREFRTKLLIAPGPAIREAFGVDLPEGTRFKFVERDTDADYTHVLPDLHDDEEELSDDDLDAAAGGNDDWFGEGGG